MWEHSTGLVPFELVFYEPGKLTTRIDGYAKCHLPRNMIPYLYRKAHTALGHVLFLYAWGHMVYLVSLYEVWEIRQVVCLDICRTSL